MNHRNKKKEAKSSTYPKAYTSNSWIFLLRPPVADYFLAKACLR
jgi:hypothetical protein